MIRYAGTMAVAVIAEPVMRVRPATRMANVRVSQTAPTGCVAMTAVAGAAVDVVMSCSLRRDQSGKLVGFVCAGQNMDTLGGPQPQVTRQALARAAAIASAPT